MAGFNIGQTEKFLQLQARKKRPVGATSLLSKNSGMNKPPTGLVGGKLAITPKGKSAAASPGEIDDGKQFNQDFDDFLDNMSDSDHEDKTAPLAVNGRPKAHLPSQKASMKTATGRFWWEKDDDDIGGGIDKYAAESDSESEIEASHAGPMGRGLSSAAAANVDTVTQPATSTHSTGMGEMGDTVMFGTTSFEEYPTLPLGTLPATSATEPTKEKTSPIGEMIDDDDMYSDDFEDDDGSISEGTADALLMAGLNTTSTALPRTTAAPLPETLPTIPELPPPVTPASTQELEKDSLPAADDGLVTTTRSSMGSTLYGQTVAPKRSVPAETSPPTALPDPSSSSDMLSTMGTTLKPVDSHRARVLKKKSQPNVFDLLPYDEDSEGSSIEQSPRPSVDQANIPYIDDSAVMDDSAVGMDTGPPPPSSMMAAPAPASENESLEEIVDEKEGSALQSSVDESVEEVESEPSAASSLDARSPSPVEDTPAPPPARVRYDIPTLPKKVSPKQPIAAPVAKSVEPAPAAVVQVDIQQQVQQQLELAMQKMEQERQASEQQRLNEINKQQADRLTALQEELREERHRSQEQQDVAQKWKETATAQELLQMKLNDVEQRLKQRDMEMAALAEEKANAEQAKAAEEEEARKAEEARQLEEAKKLEETAIKPPTPDPEVDQFKKEREWEERWVHEREEREQVRMQELVTRATIDSGAEDALPRVQPLRASLIAGLGQAGIDGEAFSFIQKEIKEQEVLIEGYQTENQRLVEHLRAANARGRAAETKIADAAAKERENSSLRLTIAALQADLDAARKSMSDALQRARSTRIEQLEGELVEAREQNDRRESDFRAEVQRLKSLIDDGKKAVKHAKEEGARELRLVQQKLATASRRAETDVTDLQSKIDWYEENQKMIDENDVLIQQQKTEIELLKNRLARSKSAAEDGQEAGTEGGSVAAAETHELNEQLSKMRIRERESSRKVKELQKQIEGLEDALKARHPNSIAALIHAAQPSEEESTLVVQLRERIKELEENLSDAEASADKRLRVLRQELDKMKVNFKQRAKHQKGRVPELEKQIEELRAFYQKRIRELERDGGAVDRSVQSPKPRRWKRKGPRRDTEDKDKDRLREMEESHSRAVAEMNEEISRQIEMVGKLQKDLGVAETKRREAEAAAAAKVAVPPAPSPANPPAPQSPPAGSPRSVASGGSEKENRMAVRVPRSHVEPVPVLPVEDSKVSVDALISAQKEAARAMQSMQAAQKKEEYAVQQMDSLGRALQLAESEVSRLRTEIAALRSRPTLQTFQDVEKRIAELELSQSARSAQVNRKIQEAVANAVAKKNTQIDRMRTELEGLLETMAIWEQRFA